MCDCFHVVLPTWPGAPGSGAPHPGLQPASLGRVGSAGAPGLNGASGRQLQQQDPGAETEEDYSVTEGPVGEIIRPRPQGSSPVYEYTVEGAGFGDQESSQGRRSSSGRRRSWWKRDSGESTAFSSMSHPETMQEATEVTLKTEVEAGASGYTVTGGGDQGIFVKQVLKGSSAAKLFSLREGDQLLSATIFFDHMKYEDALKILQYSEPYKVQFRIKRKLSASKGEESAVLHSQQKQDRETADEYMETPTKTLEVDGDRERLISKSRDSCQRRPQDRLSWPKFQALGSKQGTGPRRSHSSSEASEQRDTHDVSPTSTDIEAQLTADSQEQKSGTRRRRRRFLNLRFGMSSGQGANMTEQTGREPQDRRDHAGLLEESQLQEDETQASGFMSALSTQKPMKPSHSNLEKEGPGEMVVKTDRHQRKKKQLVKQDKEKTLSQHRAEPATGRSWDDEWEVVESLEIGIARLSLQDKPEQGNTQIALCDAKITETGFSKKKTKETKKGTKEGGLGEKVWRETDRGRKDRQMPAESQGRTGHATEKGGKDGTAGWESEQERKVAEQVTQTGQIKMKMPKFRIPSFGWSPTKEAVTEKRERKEVSTEDDETLGKEKWKEETEKRERQSEKDRHTSEKMESRQRAQALHIEQDIVDNGGECSEKEISFKMTKLKVPSFGESPSGKPGTQASVVVPAPKMETEVSLLSMKGELKTPDIGIELPNSQLEVKASQKGMKLLEGQQSQEELPSQDASGDGRKGPMGKTEIPSMKMPKVDLKGPHIELQGPKVDIKGLNTGIELSVPREEMDIRAPSAEEEKDLEVTHRDMAARDSWFKMPKFKMPSFGTYATGKQIMEATTGVAAQKTEGDMSLSATEKELKNPDMSIQQQFSYLEVEVGKGDMKPVGEQATQDSAGDGLKGHLPKVKMPSFKMPKEDQKGPHVDLKDPTVEVKSSKAQIRSPEIEVSLPGVKVDIQAPGDKLQEDLPHAEKDVATKDSKFKMPKFKMPSFGASSPGKPRMEATLEVAAPKMEADMSLSSIQGDINKPDLSIQQAASNLEVKAGQVDVKMPEGQLPEGEQATQDAAGVSLKGHIPKVQRPSFKMPKVDLKGPHVEIEGPKMDMKSPKSEVKIHDSEVSLPSMEIDIQAPGAKLDGEQAIVEKDMAVKDSKFKMPTLKMPSFGVSAIGKPSMEATVEVEAPKLEADVTLPSMQGDGKAPDISIQLPSSSLEVKTGQVDVKMTDVQLPEGEQETQDGAGARLKGHLPQVHMPSFKIPKVDLKGPHVDLKEPTVEVKSSKAEIRGPDIEVSLPGVKVDIQAPGDKLQEDLPRAEKDVATKDRKFKMPKFKMPSFGVSAIGKPSMEATVEVAAPKLEADMSLPSMQSDGKAPDLSIQLPSSSLEVKTGQLDVKMTDVHRPEGEQETQDTAGAGLKGHLPQVHMPSFKIPKVDLKEPHVDLKEPTVEVKSSKAEIRGPDIEVSLPGVKVDIQAPGDKLQEDLPHDKKDVASKDSKFKMPKFKMPSFGASSHGKPGMEGTLEVATGKMEADVSLSSIQGDINKPDLIIQQAASNLEVKAGQVDVKMPDVQLPEEEQATQDASGARLKGHLPKVQMPSFKMPKVDLKGPHVEMKGPKVDMKSPKSEVKIQDSEGSLPSMEIDVQAPGAKLDGEQAIVEKDMAVKDSKFKMPTLKMPSFGVSAIGKPSMEATVEVATPKLETDVSLPSMQGDGNAPDISIQLPSSSLEVKTGQVDVKMTDVHLPEGEQETQDAAGTGLKGHLPQVHMPSFKIPKVDLKGPHVDPKEPTVEVKSSKAEIRGPDIEVSLPGVKVDIQAPGDKLQEDLPHAEKDVATKDSKFKMPKFKMPSFGASSHGKPGMEGTLEVAAAKLESDVSLSSIQGDINKPDLTIQQAASNLEVKAGQVDVKMPDVQLPEGEQATQDAAGARLKGHLPKVQRPSFKMHKVDLKGPHVEMKGPKVDMKSPKSEVKIQDSEVSLPSMEIDVQALGAKLDGEQAIVEKDMAVKDSKFKMPTLKMPSFGVSAIGKPSIEATVEVAAPKLETDVSLPSMQGDGNAPDISIKLPSSSLEVKTGQFDVKMTDVHLPEGEQETQDAAGARLKGQLPQVHMPSFKIPKVDLKGPTVEVKSSKAEIRVPDLEVSLPGVKVDIKAPGDKLQEDLPHDKKDVATKDSKFKMPNFKMSSFRTSSHGKPGMEGTLEVAAAKLEADLSLSSIQGDIKTPDLSIQLLSSSLEVKARQVDVKMTDVQLPEGEQETQDAAGAQLKGHLPQVHMPSFKMPKVDLKGPNMDVKEPTVEVKSSKAEIRGPDIEVSLPGVKVDIQAPGDKLQEDLPHAEKDVATKDNKFKMPKFKIPSFGASSHGKPGMEGPLEVAAAKLESDVSLSYIQGDINKPDLSIQQAASNLEVKAGQVDVKMPEGQLPEGEQATQDASGARLKGHLPKVQMPSFKMPKVHLKGPHVEMKGPKVDMKSPKSEVKIQDSEVSLPSMEIDVQDPGAKLDGEQAIVEKDMAVKDSKFKMPTLKMPSFGVSAIGKPSIEATVEVAAPKLETDVSLPSMQGDGNAPDISIKLPSSSLEVKTGQFDVKMTDVHLPEGEQETQDAAGARLKGQLPQVHMPSFKIPKVDLKGPHVDPKEPTVEVKSSKAEIRGPDVEVSLPSVKVDIQAPGDKLQEDLPHDKKDVATKDSKFKMPKFKMPSFGASSHGKPGMEGPLEVAAAKLEADLSLSSIQGDIKTPDLSIQLLSSGLEVKAGQVDVKMTDVQLTEGEQETQDAAGAQLKGHLPQVHMPSFKIPKVDLKGPHMDVKEPTVEVKSSKAEIRGTDIEVTLPGVKVDILAPGDKLQEDLPHAEKDVATKDSKFKMPKFKMPSFGASSHGKPGMEGPLEVAAAKLESDVSLSSIQGDIIKPDLSIQQAASNLEVKAGQVDVKMPEGQLPEGEQATQDASGARLKGHLPKVQMPSFKMPKVDLKGPHVEIEGPKVDMKSPKSEVKIHDSEGSLPSMEIDVQAPGAKLDGEQAIVEKDMAVKDSKFKMPTLKMPSFGVSAIGKPSMEATVEVAAPKLEADVSLPSMQGDGKAPDISIQLPSSSLEVKTGQVDVKMTDVHLPEGEQETQDAAGTGLKGHLPQVHMPSFKIPKVDLKGPHVDLKEPTVEVKSSKAEIRGPDIEVSLPGVKVDIQAPGDKLQEDLPHAEKDVATKDSKFKMPKFKMPSFGVSSHGKPGMEGTLEVAAAKVESDMSLSSIQGDINKPDLTIQQAASNLEVKAGQVDVKMPEGQLPEGEQSTQDASGARLKGHLPKVQMPSFKMPKVHLKGPHVEMKGPKVDMKSPKSEVKIQDSEVCLPSMEIDVQDPGAKLDGEQAIVEKDMAVKDSKFKMPTLKMPSFGVSAIGKPSIEATVEVAAPKLETDVSLPSMQGDGNAPDISIKLPSSSLEVKTGQFDVKMTDVHLPEGEQETQDAAGARLKGQLPQVHMPSFKIPKVDLKGPHVDPKEPTVEVKSSKAEIRGPEVEVSLPGVKVDIQAPGDKLQEDLPHDKKDVATKDSKFKMPKFKMPSFGASSHGKPGMEGPLEVAAAKLEADLSLSSIQGDIKTPDLSIQLLSSSLEVKAGQVDVKMTDVHLPEGEQETQDTAGAQLKGHLPQVHMPSFKIPKVDLKGPHMDVKEPTVEVKSSKAEIRGPDIEVSLPGVKVDIQAPGDKLQEDLPHAEKDVATKDSKFKMPKFKIPSFGASSHGKPGMEGPLEVAAAKLKSDVSLSYIQGDINKPDLSIQQAASNLEVKAGQVDVKMPEGQLPKGQQATQDASGARLKGHLPKVQMPSFKMPKVDLKGPHVEIEGPKVDMKSPKSEVKIQDSEVSLPSMEIDVQAPGAKLDGEQAIVEKDMAVKDSKFKMPTLKMPSFGVSAIGKPSMEATVEVAAPKLEADVSLLSMQGDGKAPDISIQLPSSSLEVKTGQVDVKMPDVQLPEGEQATQDASGARVKGHLPKVQMPSFKMPKVDLQGPHLEIEGTKVDTKSRKTEVKIQDSEVSLPSMDIDVQAPGAKLDGEQAIVEKDMAVKDSKLKMPTLKMPSFGVSAIGKPNPETNVEVAAPKLEADVSLPSMQGDSKAPDLSIKLTSSSLEVKAGQVDVKMTDVQLPEGEQETQDAAGARLKGHLPQVHMPSFKIPKVDLKGPHLDVKEPTLEVKSSKAEIRGPDIEVSLPGVKVDIQAPGDKLQEDLPHAEKDVATKDSKFKMPKFKMPSFGSSSHGKPGMEATVELAAPKMEADLSLSSIQGDNKTPDLRVQQAASKLVVNAGQVDVKMPEGHLLVGEQATQDAAGDVLKGLPPKVQIPSFKIPKVVLKDPTLDLKSPKVKAMEPDMEASLSVAEVDIHAPCAMVQGPLVQADNNVSSKDGNFKMPKFKMPSFSVSATCKPSVDASVVVAASKMEAGMSMPSLQGDIVTPDLTIQLPSPDLEVKASQMDIKLLEGQVPQEEVPAQAGLGSGLKVHLPKVQMPSLKMRKAALKGPTDGAKIPTDVVSRPNMELSLSGVQVDIQALPSSVDASMVEEPPVSHVSSESSVDKSHREGEGSSFKLPHIKLPPFTLSPKKKAESAGDSESPQVDPIHSSDFSVVEMDPKTGTCASPVESHQHVSIEKEAEKGRSRKLSFSMPRLALSKIKGSKGRADMPEGEVKPSLTGTTAGGNLVFIQTTVSDTHVGGTRSKDVVTDPCIRSPSMIAEVTGCKTDLEPLEDALDIRGDSKSRMFVGVSASQPFGELTAPMTGDLQPSCRQRHNASTMASPEMDPTAKETSRYSHERRFKMPKFRVPDSRRSSSKERDGAGEQEATQTPDAGIAIEAEVAAATVWLSNVPESKLEAHVPLGSPEEGISVETPKSPTYADVVKRDLHERGFRLYGSTVVMSQTHLSTHELGTHPAKDSSFEMSSVRVSELQLPPEGTGKQQHPGSGGNTLAEVEAGAGSWPSQPQGPLRLKASITDMPSQVSVVSTSQLWEDSVLTVTFPKLKVPKFSFHASSSEADVFFPVVTEVQCAEASNGSAVHKDGPGLWEASILKTGAEDPKGPPVSLEQSLEPSPISKVRVHIQGSQGESQEVTVCSRVEREGSDSSACGAFSTQIVRESEIPVSTIQTPSYGFSLLKVKIPEPSVQASVQTVAPGCQVREDSVGGAPQAAAGRHFPPADFPPDTGEPFEMISSSVGVPVPPLSFTPEVPPGPQFIDSTSDEEPAEILEFPEDSQEVKTPEMATKQKPEGKKASLLWSWLPSIGFSSVEEMAADSRDATQRPAPVHVQPAARLDPELPRKQEKAGWFRFPKLGFSSSPTKKSRSAEGGDGQVEQKPQEETLTFFDARESFSLEEEEAEPEVTSASPGSKAMVASSARTELVLLEQARDTGDKSTPRPVAK
ncbi:Protein AHNAK2 [Lemmus lemmus]